VNFAGGRVMKPVISRPSKLVQRIGCRLERGGVEALDLRFGPAHDPVRRAVEGVDVAGAVRAIEAEGERARIVVPLHAPHGADRHRGLGQLA
jgi:hypothetical protein